MGGYRAIEPDRIRVIDLDDEFVFRAGGNNAREETTRGGTAGGVERSLRNRVARSDFENEGVTDRSCCAVRTEAESALPNSDGMCRCGSNTDEGEATEKALFQLHLGGWKRSSSLDR